MLPYTEQTRRSTKAHWIEYNEYFVAHSAIRIGRWLQSCLSHTRSSFEWKWHKTNRTALQVFIGQLVDIVVGFDLVTRRTWSHQWANTNRKPRELDSKLESQLQQARRIDSKRTLQRRLALERNMWTVQQEGSTWQRLAVGDKQSERLQLVAI